MWDMVVRSSALKYTGAFVDVARPVRDRGRVCD